MDMLEHSLTTTDEAMDDMERFLLTITSNNVLAQSADDDGSLIRTLQLLSGRQHNVEVVEQEEDEAAAEFFDRARASDDDGDGDGDDDYEDLAYQFADPEFGYPMETVQVLGMLAQRLEVDLEAVMHLFVYGLEAYGDGDGDGGAVVVLASGAAVAGLEKRAFHVASSEGCECGCGVTVRCAICLEDFEDGEEVTVMSCSDGHEFHSGCITELLGQKNTCPLCRHALPTDVDDVGP